MRTHCIELVTAASFAPSQASPHGWPQSTSQWWSALLLFSHELSSKASCSLVCSSRQGIKTVEHGMPAGGLLLPSYIWRVCSSRQTLAYARQRLTLNVWSSVVNAFDTEIIELSHSCSTQQLHLRNCPHMMTCNDVYMVTVSRCVADPASISDSC